MSYVERYVQQCAGSSAAIKAIKTMSGLVVADQFPIFDINDAEREILQECATEIMMGTSRSDVFLCNAILDVCEFMGAEDVANSLLAKIAKSLNNGTQDIEVHTLDSLFFDYSRRQKLYPEPMRVKIGSATPCDMIGWKTAHAFLRLMWIDELLKEDDDE